MFVLPHTSIVNRVVPKNSFDKYINTKQKKLFSEFIDKIKWTNKLSSNTINLEGKEVNEIQIFEITLKSKNVISDLLNIIDRNIPYHIIFVLKFENLTLISASQKHMHPTVTDTFVIDWRFSSDWILNDGRPFTLNLKTSLDEVFSDFCFQILGRDNHQNQSLQQIISIEQKKKQLKSEISTLESEIKKCNQFNKKVELNMALKLKILALEKL